MFSSVIWNLWASSFYADGKLVSISSKATICGHFGKSFILVSLFVFFLFKLLCVSTIEFLNDVLVKDKILFKQTVFFKVWCSCLLYPRPPIHPVFFLTNCICWSSICWPAYNLKRLRANMKQQRVMFCKKKVKAETPKKNDVD